MTISLVWKNYLHY